MTTGINVTIKDANDAMVIGMNLHAVMDSCADSIEKNDEAYQVIKALGQEEKDRLAMLGAAVLSLTEYADNMVKDNIDDLKKNLLEMLSKEVKAEVKGVDEEDVTEEYIPAKEHRIDPMYG